MTEVSNITVSNMKSNTNKLTNNKIKLNLTDVMDSTDQFKLPIVGSKDSDFNKNTVNISTQSWDKNKNKNKKEAQSEKLKSKFNQQQFNLRKYNTIMIPENKINISKTIESKYKNMFDNKKILSGLDLMIKDTDRYTNDDLKVVSAIIENKSVHPNHIDYSLQIKDQLRSDAKKDLDFFIELK